jgi:minor extracellular serine protease Vpr
VLSATQNSVTIQIPWELDVNSPLKVSVASEDSPFESAISVQPVLTAPRALRQFFRADFTPPPQHYSPKPGEVLILYMTGLGPVNPPVATGQAAPLTPLSYAQLPLDCVWDPPYSGAPPGAGGQTADFQFAGLAPGTIGVYQVNISFPSAFAGTELSDHSLQCTALLPFGKSSVAAQ